MNLVQNCNPFMKCALSNRPTSCRKLMFGLSLRRRSFNAFINLQYVGSGSDRTKRPLQGTSEPCIHPNKKKRGNRSKFCSLRLINSQFYMYPHDFFVALLLIVCSTICIFSYFSITR